MYKILLCLSIVMNSFSSLANLEKQKATITSESLSQCTNESKGLDFRTMSDDKINEIVPGLGSKLQNWNNFEREWKTLKANHAEMKPKSEEESDKKAFRNKQYESLSDMFNLLTKHVNIVVYNQQFIMKTKAIGQDDITTRGFWLNVLRRYHELLCKERDQILEQKRKMQMDYPVLLSSEISNNFNQKNQLPRGVVNLIVLSKSK